MCAATDEDPAVTSHATTARRTGDRTFPHDATAACAMPDGPGGPERVTTAPHPSRTTAEAATSSHDQSRAQCDRRATGTQHQAGLGTSGLCQDVTVLAGPVAPPGSR